MRPFLLCLLLLTSGCHPDTAPAPVPLPPPITTQYPQTLPPTHYAIPEPAVNPAPIPEPPHDNAPAEYVRYIEQIEAVKRGYMEDSVRQSQSFARQSNELRNNGSPEEYQQLFAAMSESMKGQIAQWGALISDVQQSRPPQECVALRDKFLNHLVTMRQSIQDTLAAFALQQPDPSGSLNAISQQQRTAGLQNEQVAREADAELRQICQRLGLETNGIR